MPLILEDGTGLAEADTYVALVDYQDYGASIGWSLAGDDADEINLRRAFQALNRLWGYLGAPVNVDQAGAFPRSGSDGVPQRVKDAQCELAYLIQGGLDPFARADSSTSETIKIGPISIGGHMEPANTDRIKAVEGLLRPYLSAGPGQVRTVRG